MFYTLLVDANVSFRQALSDVLLVYFPLIDVEEAGDVTEALSKVECLRPNIVFMDIQLPGGNGLEISKKIRRMYNDIVIVILTANNLPEHRQQAFENGANHYISKGDDSCMEEILTLIEESLDSRSPIL
jgi:CheY-like chemotaxis protein